MSVRYRCSECGADYPLEPLRMVCDPCSKRQLPDEPLRGVLDVWRSEAAPEIAPFDGIVEPGHFAQVPVGNTPLCSVSGLTAGRPNVFVKYEAGNLSGSFKDRASWLVAAYARRHGLAEIVLASTGNAGSSMAGIGAAAGLAVTLFLPQNAPKAKMIQALQYGARLVLVAGTYDHAYELSIAWSRRHGYLNRNTAYNPLTIEGKKTAALEIVNQLGRAPDHVFVPCGDGVILSGTYKGFSDMIAAGAIATMPVLWAVQASGSNAIARAFKTGEFKRMATNTLADSLAVEVPRNGFHALAKLKRHKGRCIEVSDEAILAAQKQLASASGFYLEPAAAAAWAGFNQVSSEIDKGATVVLLATGTGLKDSDSAARGVSLPQHPIRSIDELENIPEKGR